MLRMLTLVAVTVGVAVAAVAPPSSFADGASPPDYTPDPASLRKHKAPKWFEDAKFGYFIHWGPYSVPASRRRWRHAYAEWYWNEHQEPGQPDLNGTTGHVRRGLPVRRLHPAVEGGEVRPACLGASCSGTAGAKYFVLT